MSRKITLLTAMLVAVMTAGVLPAHGQVPTTPGTPELHNLEHVFNFNPEEHEPGRHPSVGSDLEFFTHTVPLRDYSTGAFIDQDGNTLPDGAEPVMAERGFAVMGSYERGGYVFDITDPENTQFVTQVTCRQERNDVGIKKFADPETGETRVVLALTQQTGVPCGEAGVGFEVNAPQGLQGFHGGVQWSGTAPVDGQTGKLVYGGTGCTPASYAPVLDEIQGNIALVDDRESADGSDQCPRYTFFQKVRSAQEVGAIGFIQIPREGSEPNGNATAIAADIPGLEVNRTDEVLAVRDAVAEGTEVEATLTEAPSDVPVLGSGSGGIGVFDITDPFEWSPMYRLKTGRGGVHNFIFHPTEPYGYASNGALPGLINQIPIVDFTDLDQPQVLDGPQTEGGVHDIEFSPDGDRAYAASENNYRIYDTTDPANPVLLSRTPNVGTYAHGVFPSPDLSLMVTNNESLALGGFFAEGTTVCPGEGLASYDITNEGLPIGPLGYYVPDVVGHGPDHRACTSHFGRFAPGTKVLSMGWYIAGTRVVDWSNPSNPVEVAGAVMDDEDGQTETWAAKFHKGPYVYAGDLGRGFDVFRWSGDGPAPWAPQADLSVSKDAPETALVGDEVPYTIEVSNEGPNDATGVTVTDQLPAGDVELTSAPQGCQESGRTVTCELGDLAAGDSTTVELTVRLWEPGTFTNTAGASAEQSDPDADNNEATASTEATCTITGTEGADRLRGTRGSDVICGLAGNDLILGQRGDDVVIGGDGSDRLIGNHGDDIVRGGPGTDRLLGGHGDDWLDGGPGDDKLNGGPGQDRCTDPDGAMTRNCEE